MKRRSGSVRRRLGQAAVALGIVAGLSVSTIGSAAATGTGALTCAYEAGNYNVCIRLDEGAANEVIIHIGIDLTMPQALAQAQIDLPGEEFTTVLYGADGSPSDDDPLLVVPMTGDWAWSGGLSAEFDMFVDRSVLDEDDGLDEIFATVTLHVPWKTATYPSAEVHASF